MRAYREGNSPTRKVFLSRRGAAAGEEGVNLSHYFPRPEDEYPSSSSPSFFLPYYTGSGGQYRHQGPPQYYCDPRQSDRRAAPHGYARPDDSWEEDDEAVYQMEQRLRRQQQQRGMGGGGAGSRQAGATPPSSRAAQRGGPPRPRHRSPSPFEEDEEDYDEGNEEIAVVRSTERVRYRNEVTLKLLDFVRDVSDMSDCKGTMCQEIFNSMCVDPRYTEERKGMVLVTRQPTPEQSDALEETVAALDRLQACCVELVATYLTPEEKRYLGLNTHFFQSKRERSSTYQYMKPARHHPASGATARTTAATTTGAGERGRQRTREQSSSSGAVHRRSSPHDRKKASSGEPSLATQPKGRAKASSREHSSHPKPSSTKSQQDSKKLSSRPTPSSTQKKSSNNSTGSVHATSSREAPAAAQPKGSSKTSTTAIPFPQTWMVSGPPSGWATAPTAAGELPTAAPPNECFPPSPQQQAPAMGSSQFQNPVSAPPFSANQETHSEDDEDGAETPEKVVPPLRESGKGVQPEAQDDDDEYIPVSATTAAAVRQPHLPVDDPPVVEEKPSGEGGGEEDAAAQRLARFKGFMISDSD